MSGVGTDRVGVSAVCIRIGGGGVVVFVEDRVLSWESARVLFHSCNIVVM